MKLGVIALVIALAWGNSFDLTTWKSFLQAVDSSLPHLSVTDTRICYFFEASQLCSGDGLRSLLELATSVDTATWTPIASECEALLDGQRIYAENIVAGLFAAAILSAGQRE